MKLLVLLVSRPLHALQYRLVEQFSGTSFFDNFDFFNGTDPTLGHVDYVTRSEANKLGLISNPDGRVVIAAEHNQTSPKGRKSIRLESKKTYNKALIIADVNHIPFGCGVWPAFWTYGDPWPYKGEIDIIEGINRNPFNAMTLHTGYDCNFESFKDEINKQQSGQMVLSDCNSLKISTNDNDRGCSTRSFGVSFGEKFNENGGGIYAMQWTDDFIKIFFFPRDSYFPTDIGGDNPDPDMWGAKPLAFFPLGPHCPSENFLEQKIIINIDFCGTWAGEAWYSSDNEKCNRFGRCPDFVTNNPEEFKEAYFDFNSIRIYSS